MHNHSFHPFFSFLARNLMKVLIFFFPKQGLGKKKIEKKVFCFFFSVCEINSVSFFWFLVFLFIWVFLFEEKKRIWNCIAWVKVLIYNSVWCLIWSDFRTEINGSLHLCDWTTLPLFLMLFFYLPFEICALKIGNCVWTETSTVHRDSVFDPSINLHNSHTHCVFICVVEFTKQKGLKSPYLNFLFFKQDLSTAQ